MASSSNLCEICKISVGCYTCPRCNVSYCSTNCYQSEIHLECSENFFKDCVDEMLKSTENDPGKKQTFEEILNKYKMNDLDEQLLDSDDENDVEPLEERLKNVNLDDSDLVWSKLTETEKNEYFQFLHNGDLTKINVDLWEPFWINNFKGKVIDLDNLNNLKEKCPKIVKIKDFRTISSQNPAACVQNNLINILGSYVFTTRYFNGEHFNEIQEAISCICNISAVFKSNRNFTSFDEAVKSVIYEYKNLSWVETSEENENLLMTDLENVLKGPHITENKYFILCCLSDLSKLFKSGLKNKVNKVKDGRGFRKTFQPNEIQQESPERIKMHARKLDYYLSYVKDVLSNDFCK